MLVTAIEADWLWNFLQRIDGGRSLLSRAQTLAAMPAAQKTALAAWVRTVSALPAQFQPAPPQWPVNRPVARAADWQAFKGLLEAFYEMGFRKGSLPYQPDGTPIATGGVTYADYVSAFRVAHRLNLNPDAREVCVLCGGPLGELPQVDHWINKAVVPLLSVCADNLQLVCGACNEPPNKGQKKVHSNGNFSDWFHPYLRPGNGMLQLGYVLSTRAVRCSATPANQPKADRLDELINLSSRWTIQFKAEYVRQQDLLSRRERKLIDDGKARHTLLDIQNHLQQWAADLSPSEPHHAVHAVLSQSLMQPARAHSWLAELASIT